MNLFYISFLLTLSVVDGMRHLRGLQECGVESFSLYDGENFVPMPSVLDLNDYEEISVVANTNKEACQGTIKCVKLSFAGYERKEKVTPYTLYGDLNGHYNTRLPEETGLQTLEAWTYADRDCEGQVLGYMSMSVEVMEKKCAITGFDLVDSGSVTWFTNTLDLNDYGDINLIANVQEDCASIIKCVKLSFAGDERYEKVPPYTLYGDYDGQFFSGEPKQSGEQTLEAWAYTNRDCSGTEVGYKSVQVDVISKEVPKEGTVNATTITVLYESTTGPANEVQTNAAAFETCNYIQDTLSDGMLYKSDISLTDFFCTHFLVDNGSPLKIGYEISASFKKGTGFNPYVNRRLPTQEEVDDWISRAVSGQVTCAPWCWPLLEAFQSAITDGPYSTVTGLSLE